jgi:tetratricopeptide (TPR) repeat protein
VRQIAQELGVDAVIEPLVRWAADSLTIDLRVVDGRTEEYIAAPIVRAGASRDVFRFYKELVGQLAEVMGLSLSPEAEARLAQAEPVDPQAYADYLNGRFYFGTLNPEALETAERYFRAALQKDPGFAEAHAGVAITWLGRQQLGLVPPIEAAPKAREALELALAADSTAAFVQAVAAGVRSWVNWDWTGAELSYLRAIEINPSDAEVRAGYSHLLMLVGRWEECEAQINRAMELDPLNPMVLSFFGQILNFGRKFPDAVSFFEEALRTVPGNPVAHQGLMVVYHEMGRHEESLSHAAALLSMFTGEDLNPVFQEALSDRGPEEAWKLAAAAFGESWPTPYETSLLFDWAGDLDEAFYWLEEGYEMRDPNITYVAVTPYSEALRADPRFQDLLQRMNLPYFPVEEE